MHSIFVSFECSLTCSTLGLSKNYSLSDCTDSWISWMMTFCFLLLISVSICQGTDYYTFVRNNLDYNDANECCKDSGEYLASIHTSDQSKLLLSLCEVHNNILTTLIFESNAQTPLIYSVVVAGLD